MEGTIYLLDNCNGYCTHCIADKNKNKLTLKQIETIKEYADYFKIKKFALLGGEPLLYHHLEKTIEILPKTTVYTNGILVKEKIDILKKANTVIISIDGNKEYSEKIRGKGSWKTSMDALTILKNEMPQRHDDKGKIINNLFLRCSYSEENYDDIKILINEISVPYKIPIVFFPRVDLPPLSTEKQIELYTYIMNQEESDCLIEQPNFYQYIGKPGRCPAGSYRLNFCSNGKITPCDMDYRYNLGQIGIDPEILELNIKNYIDNFKIGPIECSSCANVDVCKGGCLICKTYRNCPMIYKLDIFVIAQKEKMDPAKLNMKCQRLLNIRNEAAFC